MSPTVPTPLKFHGRIVGAPGELTYAKDIHRYFEALDKASDRASYWTIGKSEEGRDMAMLAIADEVTISQLAKYKGMLAQLTDPRRTTEAQAQQLALARLVLADPHTLVLDEATSLIDPRAARHLERSLAAVLHGRTVIAIAHRLFSAHDADRVAVVEDGVISEFGSHDELVAAGGSYAALWDSWNGKH